MKKIILFIIILVLVFIGLYIKDTLILADEKETLKGTKELELLEAIVKHDKSRIQKLIKSNPTLINSQNLPKQWTPLMWTVRKEYVDEVKLLLELGANPNIKAYGNNTALLESMAISRTNANWEYNLQISKLLLEYGANPNIAYCDPPEAETTYNICGTTSLIKASIRSLNKVKLLLKYGANINDQNIDGETAASTAVIHEEIDIAYYLIVKKEAELSFPIKRVSLQDIPGLGQKTFYPIEYFRDWVYDLDSENYRKKMKIIKYLEKQGLDYNETKPDIRTLQRIKNRYPSSWQEYLKKY